MEVVIYSYFVELGILPTCWKYKLETWQLSIISHFISPSISPSLYLHVFDINFLLTHSLPI
jgi:hypothetical protein